MANMSEELRKIAWKDSVWFSDIDDTLINTAGATQEASDGIRKVFEARFGAEKANQVQIHFNNIFNLMLAGLRNKTDLDWEKVQGGRKSYDELWKQIENYQLEIKEKYGLVKKFSREVFIKIATDRIGLSASSELISEAADAYWVGISELAEVYPGVLGLIQEIREHNRPLYLVTSSDARFKLKDSGQFEYNPKESEDFKRERIQLLRNRGIDFNLVSIGDPEDKPHIDFFQKAIKVAEDDLGSKIDLGNAIIMGDSFPADLQTPKEKMGFGLVVLFQEGIETKKVDSQQVNVGNLLDTKSFLYE